MIWGIIATIICILLVFKIVSRKLKWYKIDKIMRKIHISCGVLIMIVILLHFIITLKVWPTRDVSVIGTGIAAALVIILMALGYVFRKKLKGTWIALHRQGAILVVLLIVCHIITYYYDFLSYKSDISTVFIKGIDAHNVKNGTYEGEFDAGYIYARVEVSVNNRKITDISIIEHDNERGASAEKITDSIIKEQNTKVDVVSGATNSSLVIEKAVENALAGKNNSENE